MRLNRPFFILFICSLLLSCGAAPVATTDQSTIDTVSQKDTIVQQPDSEDKFRIKAFSTAGEAAWSLDLDSEAGRYQFLDGTNEVTFEKLIPVGIMGFTNACVDAYLLEGLGTNAQLILRSKGCHPFEAGFKNAHSDSTWNYAAILIVESDQGKSTYFGKADILESPNIEDYKQANNENYETALTNFNSEDVMELREEDFPLPIENTFQPSDKNVIQMWGGEPYWRVNAKNNDALFSGVEPDSIELKYSATQPAWAHGEKPCHFITTLEADGIKMTTIMVDHSKAKCGCLYNDAAMSCGCSYDMGEYPSPYSSIVLVQHGNEQYCLLGCGTIVR
jgi:hypothetical protein